MKQDILQRSSLVFPWPSHSPKHTVDRLNEDSQWKMKAEDEEALFLMSNANCALFFVNFDISGANFKAIERIPHFWRLATNGPPEPTDKLTNKTKQPGPTSLPPSTPCHLNERSPQADANLVEVAVAEEYSSDVAFIRLNTCGWPLTASYVWVFNLLATVPRIVFCIQDGYPINCQSPWKFSNRRGRRSLSFRVPLSSQSTPWVGFSTQWRRGDEDRGIVYLEEGSHWWRRRRRRSCW